MQSESIGAAAFVRKEEEMKKSNFNGGLLGMFGTGILCWLLCVFTLGIGVPWAVCKWQRWIAQHTVIDDKQLVFDGTGGALFGKYIKWFLLCIVTIGIYSLWLGIKMKKWTIEHTHTEGGEEAPAATEEA